MGKAKSFHHISTFSVFDNPSHFRKPAFEEDPLDDPRGYLLGYSESKWVAEKLVLAAFERGLRGCIYRPAEVTGSSDTGIWKLNDLVSRALVSSVRAGAFPAGEMRFHMTPVDFVARAIVALSLDGDCSGRIFHLINQNVKSHAELAPMVRDLGYRAEVVPFEEWKRRLRDLPNSPFEPLQALLDEVGHGDETIEQRYGSAEPRFSVTSTSRALEPVGIRCPPVDEQLLRTYVRYFARAGYLPA
jgi:thioester reductase-like protein